MGIPHRPACARFAIAALGLCLVSAASASPIILNCRITQSDLNGIFPANSVKRYKIGDGKWLEWNDVDHKWGTDRCVNLAYGIGNVSCSMESGSYRASAKDATGSASLTTAGKDLALIAILQTSTLREAEGSCKPSTDAF